MIKVINGKIDGFIGKDKIYIGRKNFYYGLEESVLRNIFKIGVDGNRNEVIEKYRKWLWIEFNKKGLVYNELIKIGRKVKNGEKIELVCYCKPLGCHGDIVKNCIEWMIKENLI
jgi:hypothetical protein